MARLEELEVHLLRIGSAYGGTWTYALTDLVSGEQIGYRQEEVMPTASLIKVPVLVALYRAAHEGRVKLTDRITYGDEHRCVGSGVLSRMTPGVEMLLRDAAVLMIIISDNSATNMVIDLVGLEQINETMREAGLQQTTIYHRLGFGEAGLDARKMSVSTAGEMTRLLERIARHEAVSLEASEDMLRIMRRQDYRHELSRLLPWNEMNMLDNHTENWVAEKGGSFLNGIRTSGAIFSGARGKFVMSVFCEGGTGPGTGREAEGNRVIGELGYTAWQALAAG